MEWKVIAHIETDFGEKFGIPRQSGLADTIGRIVFEPQYRDANAVRGLDGFSHLWLLWQFSESVLEDWQPTVHPPRLGGNTRMGVFATRSPFRPNAIGLSSVKLERVAFEAEGPVLYVRGADLLSGTPILDIKPYLAYTDSHPDAVGGFADPLQSYELKVVCPDELLRVLPEESRAPLLQILRQDPRPQYQDDPARKYGFRYAGFDVRFTVQGDTLTVVEIAK